MSNRASQGHRQHYALRDAARAGGQGQLQVVLSDLSHGPVTGTAHHAPGPARTSQAQGQDASLPPVLTVSGVGVFETFRAWV